MAKFESIYVYTCEKCGKHYSSEYVADICCKQYHCEKCGCETPRYFLKCESCREKEVFEKARKMTLKEYEEEFPGNPLYYGDDYYYDVGDILDRFDGEVPKYCFGTSEEVMELGNAEQIIEDAEVNTDCEDFYFDDEGLKELDAFIKAWNEKYKRNYYMVDNKIIVILKGEVQND